MSIFTHDQFQEIIQHARDARVHGLSRELLLSGINPIYTGQFTTGRNPIEQMELDVRKMNDDGIIDDGKAPLAIWLGNVKFQLSGLPRQQKVFGQYYDQAVLWGQEAQAAGNVPEKMPPAADAPARIEAAGDSTRILERILFKNELLPIGFLLAAGQAARAVCKVRVQLYQQGTPQTLANGMPILSVGSGWLIGRRHIITNHHVIGGYGDGSPLPPDQDFQDQAASATCQFGYDGDSLLGESLPVARLCACDPDLDFAILELATDIGIDPLCLCSTRFTAGGQNGKFLENEQFAVNIIQHPNGAPKQIAMRNNLATAIDGKYFAYFTDTDKGSSGSPVCDDRWRVVALHKASSRTQGEFDYQGKTSAWINVGTPIALIIDKMAMQHADIWQEIDARISGQ